MSDPTATYTPTQTTALDRVRFAVGDTNVAVDPESGISGALKPDTEYLAVIARTASTDEAIAEMAEALASQVAQDPDRYSDESGMSVSWTERVKTWLELAKRMRARIATASIETGGRTISVRPSRGGVTYPEYRRSRDWDD